MENTVKNQTDIQIVLCGISNDLDDEISHIKGLSDILCCMGESDNKIAPDAFFLLSNMLCGCYGKLEDLSKSIMEVSKSI